MALPKRKKDVTYEFELPSEKSVRYRPWRVKDEKDLLFAIEGLENKDEQLKHILSLLDSCLFDMEIESLSPTDILALAVEIHKKAKGEEVEVFFTCPHCGNKNSDPLIINLNTDMTVKKFDDEIVEIADYVFNFKEISFKENSALAKKYKDSIRKYRFFHMVASLESVIDDGETFNHFTEKEAEDFFDDMDIQDFEKLVEDFNNKIADATISKSTKCLGCEGTVRVFVNDLTDFFV